MKTTAARLLSTAVIVGAIGCQAPDEAPPELAPEFEDETLDAPELASTPDITWIVMSSWCSPRNNAMPWWGGVRGNSSVLNEVPKGDMSMCFWKYKALDQDPTADYFGFVFQTTWRHRSGPGQNDAQMYQYILAKETPVDDVFDATETVQGAGSCNAEIEVGVDVGIVGLSTTFKLCKDHKVSRTSLQPRAAAWSSERAAGLRKISTAFIQKVPEGVTAMFSPIVNVPQYKTEWDGLHWQSTPHTVPAGAAWQ